MQPAPLNAVDRKHQVSLYYQVRSEQVMPAVHTTVLLYRVASMRQAMIAAALGATHAQVIGDAA